MENIYAVFLATIKDTAAELTAAATNERSGWIEACWREGRALHCPLCWNEGRPFERLSQLRSTYG
jgi:hypothetical protein